MASSNCSRWVNAVRRASGALAGVAILAAASGCREGEVERSAVHGTVQFQGTPIEDGTIVFHPVGEAKGKPAGGEIVNGSYSIPSERGPMVGPSRVEIQALRKTGRKVPDLKGDVSQPNRPLIEEKVNYLPPQFNVDSSIVRDIAPGENSIDFAL